MAIDNEAEFKDAIKAVRSLTAMLKGITQVTRQVLPHGCFERSQMASQMRIMAKEFSKAAAAIDLAAIEIEEE